MPWRFQKRKRIIPGVRLNLSKRGVSASIGPRGAKVNVGRRGVRTTASAPGSGLYATSKARRLGCLGSVLAVALTAALASAM